MNFKERLTPTVQIKAIVSAVPRVGITTEALTKMFVYTDQCSDEIGWLGTVQHLGGRNYVIEDVFLFEQRVHGTTTEITPEGLSKFAEEMLTQEGGLDLWNSMKMWGHSHVNMGITPSGQDDKQMEEFKEIGHDFMIRLICNKKGDMKLDFYHYDLGITYLDIPWEILADDEEVELQNEIEALQYRLEAMRKQRVEVVKDPIKAEMAEKVRKFSSVSTSHGQHQGKGNNWANQYGRHVDGVWKLWSQHPATEEEKKIYPKLFATNLNSSTTKTKNGSEQGTSKGKKDKKKENGGRFISDGANLIPIDYFENDAQVMDTFDTGELFQLSLCKNFEQLVEELEDFGWVGCFSENDLERIFKMAYKVGQRFTLRQ